MQRGPVARLVALAGTAGVGELAAGQAGFERHQPCLDAGGRASSPTMIPSPRARMPAPPRLRPIRSSVTLATTKITIAMRTLQGWMGPPPHPDDAALRR